MERDTVAQRVADTMDRSALSPSNAEDMGPSGPTYLRGACRHGLERIAVVWPARMNDATFAVSHSLAVS